MDEKKSIIAELYSGSGGFDRERAVKALKQVLEILPGDHMVIFRPEAPLTADDKVLAYALVKKLLKSEGIEKSSSISGKEIKEKTDLKAGTVDSSIKKLKEDGLLVGAGSTYEISMHKVNVVIEMLENKLK